MKTGLKEYLDYFGRSAFLSVKGFAVNSIKYGMEFYVLLRELEKTQWYSQGKFKELQDAKLKLLVEHAYNNVPYYSRLFKRHGIRPVDIKCVEDLKKVPVLTKDILRAHSGDFVARNINKRFLASGWTTGTTGAPVNALRTRKAIIFENAMIWRQRRWAGVDVKSRKAAVWGTIWNNIIVSSQITRPPFWRYNIADNQMLLSYYHMSDRTLPLYFKKLEDFNPEFIEGFPSTILILARFLKKEKKFFPVKAIFTSSEPLYDVHRKEIEKQFKTKIFDLYGQAERVVAATECPEHKGMHVNPEYGIVEIIKNEDTRRGEIIGTGLNNYAMPLIRYKTGDIAQFAGETCPCGRQMPLLQTVEGRKADCIMTPDGRIIPGNGIMSAFHGINNIKESQVIQEDVDYISIKVVRDQEHMGVDVDSLISNLKNCVGDGVRLKIDMVDSMPGSDSAKRRWIISKVKIDAQNENKNLSF